MVAEWIIDEFHRPSISRLRIRGVGIILILNYVSKLPLRRKFYSKYIVHVTYTIAYRVKSSERFWNVALEKVCSLTKV